MFKHLWLKNNRIPTAPIHFAATAILLPSLFPFRVCKKSTHKSIWELCHSHTVLQIQDHFRVSKYLRHLQITYEQTRYLPPHLHTDGWPFLCLHLFMNYNSHQHGCWQGQIKLDHAKQKQKAEDVPLRFTSIKTNGIL